jgi:hypothetical protein
MSGKLDKKNVEAEVTMLCYFLVSTYLFYAFYSEIPFPNVSYVLSTNAIKLISVVLAYLILYSVVHYMVYKWDFIPKLFSMLFMLAFLLVFMAYCFYYSLCVSETKSISAAIFNVLLLILGGFLAFGLFLCILEGFSRSYDESNKKEDDEDGKTFIEGTFLFITIPLLFEYYPEIQLLNNVANGFFKLISVIAIYTVVVVLFLFILEISTKMSWLFSLFRVSTVVSPFAFYFYCPSSTVGGLIWFVLFGIGQSAERNESKSQNQTYTYVSCDDDDDDESYSRETNDEIYELRREHERLEAERREEQRRKEAERREAEKRIVSVAQKGSSIRIYGNRGFLGSINAGNNGVLQGYTSDTVTVRRGRTVYLYNYRGQFIRSHFIS